MSGRFYALCLVGMLGSLFVGYCIYFDKKRRSAPDYKKKVLARRRAAAKKQSNVVVDLRDPKVREEFLMSELVKANQMLSEGSIEEALGHFINFIQFSGNPRASMLTLQQSLPPPIFNLLIRTFAALQQEGKKNEPDVD